MTAPATYRVDIAGVTVYVKSAYERKHLEHISHAYNIMKLNLYKIANKTFPDEDQAKIAQNALVEAILE